MLGKEIEIDIEPTDKVERIKERVEEKEGIPPPQQRLIFSGEYRTVRYRCYIGGTVHAINKSFSGFSSSQHSDAYVPYLGTVP